MTGQERDAAEDVAARKRLGMPPRKPVNETEVRACTPRWVKRFVLWYDEEYAREHDPKWYAYRHPVRHVHQGGWHDVEHADENKFETFVDAALASA